MGAVVFNARHEVLLIKRGKAPLLGRWMVPGGTLEWGETLEGAAVREVREETGIDIEIETFVEVIEAVTPGDPGFHYVIIDYAARAVSGTLAAGSDALDAAWVPIPALSEYDLTANVTTVIEKALKATNRAR